MFIHFLNCSGQEEKEKTARELGRLREHLLQMEEISTREAVAGEERETELRKRIRDLEERSSVASDTVAQSENYYQVGKTMFNVKICGKRF